jgi:O-6-methylguanine DNA methyltransferase
MTYGEVARLAGYPGASRAVGSMVKKNYDPDIPCHRVIRADGTPGQYNRGAEKKKILLKREGAL